MTSPLKILTFGAGALGTYIGGSLALSGHEVVFLERPELALELARRGLRLEIQGQERVIPAPLMAASLEEATQRGPYDVALFALKSFDTAPAIESFSPYLESLPPVLCLQNGVENEPALARALGSDRVIAGTVTSAIGRRAVGDIILERLRGVGVAGGHPLSARLGEVMSGAGLNARLYPNAPGMKWSKMLTNLLANASSAILDLSPAEIFAHPGLYRLEVAQLREALRVMRGQSIPVVDLPGTPVRLLASAVKYLPLLVSRPLLMKAVGGGRGGKMPSFHIDLYAGRGKSEVDYLNGAIVRAGERLGIPTPANRLLNETLLALSEGKIPLETYRKNPARLLGQLAR